MNLFSLYTLIDVISLTILYFVFFVPRWEKDSYHLFIKTCMYVYLSFVMYFTVIIPVVIPLPFINMNPSNMEINLIPFYDLISGNGEAMREVVLNVVMFIPFGILYPFIYHRSCKKTIIASLFLTAGIELWQLISARNLNSCDITDVINNFIGALIGYGIYYILHKPVEKFLRKIFKDKDRIDYKIPEPIQKLFFILIVGQLIIRSVTVNMV